MDLATECCCSAQSAVLSWASLTAFWRVRLNANEILVSLMLSLVAAQLLNYLLLGPWKDPNGFNFPQSVMFQYDAMVPILISGTRVNVSLLLTLALSMAAWVFMQKSFTGYKLQVGGLAPRAAGYAGFNEGRAIWLSLLIGGFAAGLAGAAEVAGPLGQLQRSISTGYGYAAIIVAYLGGLHPIGIVVSALFMAGALHRRGQCHGVGKPADRRGPCIPGQPPRSPISSPSPSCGTASNGAASAYRSQP